MPNRRRRAGGLVLASSGVLLTLLFALVLLGVVPSPIPGVGPAPAQAAQTCINEVHVHYYDHNKNHPGDFGAPVTTTDATEATEIERQTRCEDPYITASHMAEKGWITNTDSAIQAEAERYQLDRVAWQQSLDRLDRWEEGATATIEDAPSSYWTYAMRAGADRTSVSVYQTHVAHGSGKVLVYRRDGVTVMHRLDCLFQPVSVQQLPEQVPPIREVPKGQGGEQPPGSPPPSSSVPPPPGTGDCKPNCPTTTVPPPPSDDCHDRGDCKSSNPDDYVYPDGKQKVDAPGAADPAPLVVETQRHEPEPAPVITPGNTTDDTPVDTGSDTNHGTVPTDPGQGCTNPDFC